MVNSRLHLGSPAGLHVLRKASQAHDPKTRLTEQTHLDHRDKSSNQPYGSSKASARVDIHFDGFLSEPFLAQDRTSNASTYSNLVR
ncbi:Pectinesterase [Fusarium oxysporum f. sp. albedinis]|nr:Pectinesterase [Fusarium oxysporum f. sp. albedinis]